MAMVHDPRFVEDVPEGRAAIPAFIVCRNAHLLCASCLGDKRSAWPLSVHDTQCPTCHDEMLKSSQPSRAVVIKLDQYTFLCRYADAGCPWKGQVSQETEHAKKLCRFRFLRCGRCGEQYRAGFALEHNELCTELVITCPEGGADCLGAPRSGMYPRSQADEHAKKLCRNRPCRNFPFCRTRTSAANLVPHEPACTFQLEQQASARQEAATQRTLLAQSHAENATLRERAERVEKALKSASEELDKERTRRRELERECDDLADKLRDEIRRYARLAGRERDGGRGGGGGGERRSRDEQRFAPATRQSWSASRSSSVRDDRWAPVHDDASAYSSAGRSRY
ncbi:uncharacterized protein RHOBADRAFT_41983 [Rhodotorula graminis WP1]|uniref:TRAF-type domain-containing protein n=1 Tax=Rhodotorula graminis (strain WP1) TaxID=578459 RepID=A0A194S7R6_RHOGW|nr:uncharacterized protein RHOBADRAFT_41983 [Rhodotorula graminis WP1]KPV76773.1 hypothetical protein RHOBADRAFT_41983 [Rhodotorula graminis WP1]